MESIAKIFAQSQQLATKVTVQQFRKIGFVFVEQRVQIHRDKICGAVVKTMRRVMAGFADGAVVFEKRIQRQAIRLNSRCLLAYKYSFRKRKAVSGTSGFSGGTCVSHGRIFSS